MTRPAGTARALHRPSRSAGALPQLLQGEGSRGMPELEACLTDALGGRWRRVVAHQRLSAGVHRLLVDVAGEERSVIAKWSPAEAARRNALVARRWLPAVGLEESGPPLLAVAAERSAERAWQVYEDLGGRHVRTDRPDSDEIGAAIDAIARVHVALAEHPMLAECRLWGGDRGIPFLAANVRDAERVLRLVDAARHGAAAAPLRDALLERMRRLREEEPDRAAALAEHGGPETLVHGDLWPSNVVLVPHDGCVRARLVDWDEAAVAPIGFDLSTFLLRFPPADRAWILDGYRRAVGRLAGWELPPANHLNPVFETAAHARLASLLVWSVAAALDGDPDWLVQRLAELLDWLDAVVPVLPAR